jgi:hypothetical protein
VRATPTAVPANVRFTDIAAGPEFGACAIAENGAAYCWTGTQPMRQLSGNHRWAGIAKSGDISCCGFTPGGSVYCWRWAIGMHNQLAEPQRVTAVPGASS